MPIFSSCNPGEPGDFAPSVGSAKHPNHSPQVVDHTYRDLSCYLEYGGQIAKHKKSENNFPAKLHEILSSPRYSHVIVWMPHGRAWKILDKELLMSTVVHTYFGQTRFTSFTRQLNNWGFKRLHQPGADYNCYYHECFLRGIPLLTRMMRRVPSNRGKFKPDAEGEPKFYQISSKNPLPPPAEHAHCSRASEGSSTEAEADITSHADASAQKKDSLRTIPPATVLAVPSPMQYLPPHRMTDWTCHRNEIVPSSKADSLPNSSATTIETSASLSTLHLRPHEMRGWTRMCNSSMPLDYTASTPAGSPLSDWPSVPHATTTQNQTKPSGMNYNHSYQMPNHYESDFQFRSRSFVNPNQSYYSYFSHPSNYAPTSCMVYGYPLYQDAYGHHSAQVQHERSTSTSDRKQGESNRTVEALPQDDNHSQESSD